MFPPGKNSVQANAQLAAIKKQAAEFFEGKSHTGQQTDDFIAHQWALACGVAPPMPLEPITKIAAAVLPTRQPETVVDPGVPATFKDVGVPDVKNVPVVSEKAPPVVPPKAP